MILKTNSRNGYFAVIFLIRQFISTKFSMKTRRFVETLRKQSTTAQKETNDGRETNKFTVFNVINGTIIEIYQNY